MKLYSFITLVVTATVLYGSVNLTTARIAYLNEKDYDRARQACLRAIEAGEIHHELFLILGGCEIVHTNWKQAADVLLKAMQIDSVASLEWIDKHGDRTYFSQAFYFAAREIFLNNEHKDALYYLNKMPTLEPLSVDAHILKGAILYKLNEIEQANNEYKHVLMVDPRNPDVHFLIGKALFEIQEFDSALAYFSNAVTYYSPRYERLLSVLFQNKLGIDSILTDSIFILWTKKDFHALDMLFKTDLGYEGGLAPHNETMSALHKARLDLARAYYYKGMSYYKKDDDSPALDNLFLCLGLKPDDTDALFFAGELLIKGKAYQKAIIILENATTLNPDDLYAWFYLGVCYTHLEQYEKALDIYENKVLPADSNRVDVLTNIAYIYNKLGNYVKADEYLRLANKRQEERDKK